MSKNNDLDDYERTINNILCDIRGDRIIQWFRLCMQDDLSLMDREIEVEKNFANENPKGSTYSSAGAKARKRIKHLKKIREEQVKLINKFEDLVECSKKINKMQIS